METLVMATEKQIEANRRNAQNSCGPKTAEGKEASRRNALKHGLSGRGAVQPWDEAQAIGMHRLAFAKDIKPRNSVEEHLVARLALAAARQDRCARQERAALAGQLDAAGRAFDAARELEVHRAAAALFHGPAEALERLA